MILKPEEKIEYDGNEPKDIISYLFEIGMWWRIFYGSIKAVLGFYLLTLTNASIPDLFRLLMRHELIEDPGDILYNIALPFLNSIDITITYFLAFYFIFWGVLDVFLSINLLREKYWAYTASLILMGLFVTYEIFRVFHNYSITLGLIILIDIGILYLIRREQKRHLGNFSDIK